VNKKPHNGHPGRLLASALLIALAYLAAPFAARAQDIEPRQWSNTPVGVNFLISGYAYTQGGLGFAPSLPITDPHLQTDNAVLGFARSLDLWGYSGKFDTSVPYTWLSGSADYLGHPTQRTVNGFGDPVFRLSVNLYGAPALGLKDYASYTQDWIVGASLQVSAPSGQYDDTRLVNIGTHRWYFKPNLGVSKAIGPWILEATAEVTFYTDNRNFFHGTTFSQDPLYGIQGHVIRSFRYGIWASVDATYFTGGDTQINGVSNNELQRNWRVGVTLALPLTARNSIKLYGSNGVSARTGDSYKLFGVVWQYHWGGGL
jgi:Putative MetA-pathway of phenol degradation